MSIIYCLLIASKDEDCTAIMFPFMNLDFSSVFHDEQGIEFSSLIETTSKDFLPETDINILRGTDLLLS